MLRSLIFLGALILSQAGPSCTVTPQISGGGGGGTSFGSGQIQHIVVIVQENRTVDYLMNGMAGADTVTNDPVSGHALHAISLADTCGLSHAYSAFVAVYNGGAMNGWSAQNCGGSTVCTPSSPSCTSDPSDAPYYKACVAFDANYCPLGNEVVQYWDFAGGGPSPRGAFYPHALQDNVGPSLPAHQFLIAGQAGGIKNSGGGYCTTNTDLGCTFYNAGGFGDLQIADNNNGGSSCNKNNVSGPGSGANLVAINTSYPATVRQPGVADCYDATTIFDLLMAHGLTWKYYQNNNKGFWSGPSSIVHLYNTSPNGYQCASTTCASNAIITCATQSLNDFSNPLVPLNNLTMVMPKGHWSDHPGQVDWALDGPDWVTHLVDALQARAEWPTTEVIITWDDWGGFYDHYKRSSGNPNCPFSLAGYNSSNSCGLRVPLIIVGPYTTAGAVDSGDTNVYGAILRHVEGTFIYAGLTTGALNTSDTWTTNDMSSTQNYANPAATPPAPEPTATATAWYTHSSCTDNGPPAN